MNISKLHFVSAGSIAAMLLASSGVFSNDVVVVPMFEEKILFTGVGKTGNTECTDLNSTTNHWFYAVPGCANLTNAPAGQDGEYAAGASVTTRFSDNGNGTITDNLTNLIWLKSASCPPLTGSWSGALAAIEELNTSGTMDTTNDCGDIDDNTDWRLPNVKELQSLLNYGDHGSPYLSDASGSGHYSEGNPFSGVATDVAYWSSSTIGVGSSPILNDDFLDNALVVDFDKGETKVEDKNTSAHIWAVRGGN